MRSELEWILLCLFKTMQCHQGDRFGQNNDGRCLVDGVGVAMNKPLAAHDVKLSADHMNKSASFHSVRVLVNDQGIAIDQPPRGILRSV
jgi:TPR repeat protein